jgi:hypothetical protein
VNRESLVRELASRAAALRVSWRALQMQSSKSSLSGQLDAVVSRLQALEAGRGKLSGEADRSGVLLVTEQIDMMNERLSALSQLFLAQQRQPPQPPPTVHVMATAVRPETPERPQPAALPEAAAPTEPEEETEVDRWLAAHELSEYRRQFRTLGVKRASELPEVDAADLDAIGMAKFDKKRFVAEIELMRAAQLKSKVCAGMCTASGAGLTHSKAGEPAHFEIQVRGAATPSA